MKDFFAEIYDQIMESGAARMLNVMSGLVPTVRTFAIITWENPQAKNISAEENNKLNRRLESSLVNAAYGFFQIKGKYGSLENPFFIMNITRDAAINLGKYGDQESIIFGKTPWPHEVLFELVYMDDKTPSRFRHVWKSDTDDMYSEYKGKKFVIPFFDDRHDKSKFEKGRIVSSRNLFVASECDTDTVMLAESTFDKYDVLDLHGKYTGKHRLLGRAEVNRILSGRT